MKKILYITFVTLILALCASACGPSEMEIATMTASAWTATPMPTATPEPSATPTPVPYDMNLSISDAEGIPLAGASVVFPESGSDEALVTDEGGMLTWNDLPGDKVSLTIMAQGYTTLDQEMTIQRGPNEVTVQLERDPLQILPSEACQPGQEALYVEDFEDAMAQGWIDLMRPAWSIGSAEGRGNVLSAYNPGQVAHSHYFDTKFGNAVWLFDMRVDGESYDMHMNWHALEEGEGLSRYFVVYKNREGLQLHFTRPGMGYPLAEAPPRPNPNGVWQRFAFAYFNGALDLWIDDELIVGADHTDGPIEAGGFGFIISEITDANIAFDNMVVCSLNEPYAPPAKIE